jgi:uncharacterized membrane protein
MTDKNNEIESIRKFIRNNLKCIEYEYIRMTIFSLLSLILVVSAILITSNIRGTIPTILKFLFILIVIIVNINVMYTSYQYIKKAKRNINDYEKNLKNRF